MTLQPTRRAADGIQFDLAYTLGKSEDTAPTTATLSVQGDAGRSNPEDLDFDRGPNVLDQRHTFSASVVATPRYEGENGLLRGLINGTILGLAIQAANGIPVNLRTNPGEINNDGIASDRPAGVPRNSLTLPARKNVDLRLSRQVPLGRTKAEIIAELTNVFNTVQWSGVTAAIPVVTATGLPVSALPTSAEQLRPTGVTNSGSFSWDLDLYSEAHGLTSGLQSPVAGLQLEFPVDTWIMSRADKRGPETGDWGLGTGDWRLEQSCTFHDALAISKRFFGTPRSVLEALWLRTSPQRWSLQPVFDGVAYTTLMTTLDRLHRKGVLDREKAGRAFVYQPRYSREALLSALAGEALEAVFGERASELRPILSFFIETVSREIASRWRHWNVSSTNGGRRHGRGRMTPTPVLGALLALSALAVAANFGWIVAGLAGLVIQRVRHLPPTLRASLLAQARLMPLGMVFCRFQFK